MSKKLIYINSNALSIYHDDQKIQYPAELKNYFNFTRQVWFESHFPHDRTRVAKLWDLYTFPEFKIPTFDPDESLTFEEITDIRAREIEQKQEESQLPIIVLWSGGIDSTLVLSAIIKNFKTTKNVTVAMNNVSYLENPVFFDKFIRNKIKTVSVGSLPKDMWMTNLVINGEPTDQMYINANILELDRRFPGCANDNVYTNGDKLITYIASKSNPDLAKWSYDMITASMKDSPVAINTYEDFFWWANFNFFAVGNVIKAYCNNTALANKESFDKFRTNFIPWCLTDMYQQWSMRNTSNGVKYNKTISSYKMPSKQYIWDLDRNDYYRYYKTKNASGLQYIYNDFRGINIGSGIAVFDNGDVIRVTEHEKIKLLLNDYGFGSS